MPTSNARGWEATLNDARVLVATERFPEAERTLRTALGTAEGSKAPDTVVAALLHELGKTLRRMGDLAAAKAQLERARTLREKLAPKSTEVLSTWLELGACLAAASDPAAEAMLSKAVGLARTALADRLPEALLASARFQLQRGSLPQAEGGYREALSLLASPADDAARVLLAQVHQDLGDLASSRGELAQAERSYALAIDTLAGRSSPDDLQSVEATRRLAATLARDGRAAEARALFEQLVEILEQTLGNQHPAVGVALSDLATAAWSQGKPADAEVLYGRALALLEARPAGVELYLANVLCQLGSLALYGKEERLEVAQRLFHRALPVYEKVLGPEHPEVATVFKHLAVSHMKEGALERAAPLARAALRIEELADRTSMRALNAASILGSIEFQRGQHAAAVPLLERTLKGLEAAGAPPGVLEPIQRQLAEARKRSV